MFDNSQHTFGDKTQKSLAYFVSSSFFQEGRRCRTPTALPNPRVIVVEGIQSVQPIPRLLLLPHFIRRGHSRMHSRIGIPAFPPPAVAVAFCKRSQHFDVTGGWREAKWTGAPLPASRRRSLWTLHGRRLGQEASGAQPPVISGTGRRKLCGRRICAVWKIAA